VSAAKDGTRIAIVAEKNIDCDLGPTQDEHGKDGHDDK
jgi:hypothetical protein